MSAQLKARLQLLCVCVPNVQSDWHHTRTVAYKRAVDDAHKTLKKRSPAEQELRSRIAAIEDFWKGAL